MATLVSRLSPALLQREELVAQVDKGRSAALAPKFKIEQSTVERQSLFNVTDLERYMVETDRARFSCFNHGTLQQFAKKDLQRTGTQNNGPTTIPSFIARRRHPLYGHDVFPNSALRDGSALARDARSGACRALRQ
jgi:hypothetical protein